MTRRAASPASATAQASSSGLRGAQEAHLWPTTAFTIWALWDRTIGMATLRSRDEAASSRTSLYSSDPPWRVQTAQARAGAAAAPHQGARPRRAAQTRLRVSAVRQLKRG